MAKQTGNINLMKIVATRAAESGNFCGSCEIFCSEGERHFARWKFCPSVAGCCRKFYGMAHFWLTPTFKDSTKQDAFPIVNIQAFASSNKYSVRVWMNKGIVLSWQKMYSSNTHKHTYVDCFSDLHNPTKRPSLGLKIIIVKWREKSVTVQNIWTVHPSEPLRLFLLFSKMNDYFNSIGMGGLSMTT